MNLISIIFTVISAFVVVSSSQHSRSSSTTNTGDPILIVPGISGSRLSVRRSGFSLCNTFGTSVGLWVSEVRILKFGCFIPEMTLNYDRNTGQYSSTSDGITVSVPGFGDTETVETLNEGWIAIPYFSDFVKYFVERGYQRGQSIRAAPYDWRFGPKELQRRGYYKDVKALIETMFSENGNRKVTIAAHSMGAPIMLHFLTQSGVVTQEWKNQYIGNFIPISGAWSGGNAALQYKISGLSTTSRGSGYMFSFFARAQNLITAPLTPILRSFESTHFLFPRSSVWGDTVLVSTPERTYTASDYEQLFSDLRLTDGFSMYQGIEDINKNFPSPNVPTHCFYGVGVDTPLSFRYARPFPRGAADDPEVTNGDGDGSVNVKSSEVCLRWANNNGGQSYESMTFESVAHLEMVKDDGVLKKIGEIVGAPSGPIGLRSLLR